MFEAFVLYFVCVNLTAYWAFWWDKRAAEQGSWRTRESTLLGLALIGGSPGALVGQQVLRHKTRKEPFRTAMWLIVALQTVAAIAGAYLLAR